MPCIQLYGTQHILFHVSFEIPRKKSQIQTHYRFTLTHKTLSSYFAWIFRSSFVFVVPFYTSSIVRWKRRRIALYSKDKSNEMFSEFKKWNIDSNENRTNLTCAILLLLLFLGRSRIHILLVLLPALNENVNVNGDESIVCIQCTFVHTYI